MTTRSASPRLVVAHAAEVGEGPMWDAPRQTLSWVDLTRGELFAYSEDEGNRLVAATKGTLGAVVPRRSGGLIAAIGRGLTVVQGASFEDTGVSVAADGERLNDAKCDPLGGLWVGVVPEDPEPGRGRLVRVSETWEVDAVVDGLSMPNGLDWSPDGTMLYLADTLERSILAIPFDIASGAAGTPVKLLSCPPEMGLPDGMTVDQQGDIWVAFWDGWALRRFDSAGALVDVVEFPVANVTSCAFGGSDMSTLFVTTASLGLDPTQRRNQPHAGGVFELGAGATGREPYAFAG